MQFVIARGGSLRLIGDDQQLAAIGAGGVLRDIKHTHGAIQLTELHRFTNPAEAQVTLALRDGDPKSLDFYLGQGRVHVGDIATTTEDALAAWATDRAAGLDAIMLAPTRELVAELNRRARSHRLNGNVPNAVVRLTDGNQASVGDVIITRSNDRRLRLTATDWVKNGDRWTITRIGQNGDLTVRHNRSRLSVRLPAHYVQHSTGLGYATTIHTAQGVSADTMHGIATGQESRQHLYTMLTRGRAANHLYLQVVGDGDPHTLIRPETVAPRTPTEILQHILARDDAPSSATTQLRHLSDPAARLCDAVRRYTDGMQVAAGQIIGPHIVQMLDSRADQLVPHLTNQPSWPTLRAHLLTLAAETGEHPLLHLHTAATGRELHTAADIAAVLDWRLPEPAPTGPGPLPWLPGVLQALHDHPVWGRYLATRSQLVTDLANQIRGHASQDETQPMWAPPGSRRTSPSLLKSPCGGPRTASTPMTHDQPGQHSCRQLRRSGNTTSTDVSPAAPTTTSVVLTSQSGSLPEPHVIAGTEIDSGCPNHPRCARTRRPAPAHRSPRLAEGEEPPDTGRAECESRRSPTDKSGSQIKSGAPRRAAAPRVLARLSAATPEGLCRQPMTSGQVPPRLEPCP